jgi:hypothetical protein
MDVCGSVFKHRTSNPERLQHPTRNTRGNRNPLTPPFINDINFSTRDKTGGVNPPPSLESRTSNRDKLGNRNRRNTLVTNDLIFSNRDEIRGSHIMLQPEISEIRRGVRVSGFWSPVDSTGVLTPDPDGPAARRSYRTWRASLHFPSNHFPLTSRLRFATMELGCRRIPNRRARRIYGGKGHDHVGHNHGQGANQESVRNPKESGESLDNAKRLRLPAEIRGGEYGRCHPSYGINHSVAPPMVEIPKVRAPWA